MDAQCSRGWADRCQTAKGSVCICDCHGANHGKLNKTDGGAQQETDTQIQEDAA